MSVLLAFAWPIASLNRHTINLIAKLLQLILQLDLVHKTEWEQEPLLRLLGATAMALHVFTYHHLQKVD